MNENTKKINEQILNKEIKYYIYGQEYNIKAISHIDKCLDRLNELSDDVKEIDFLFQKVNSSISQIEHIKKALDLQANDTDYNDYAVSNAINRVVQIFNSEFNDQPNFYCLSKKKFEIFIKHFVTKMQEYYASYYFDNYILFMQDKEVEYKYLNMTFIKDVLDLNRRTKELNIEEKELKKIQDELENMFDQQERIEDELIKQKQDFERFKEEKDEFIHNSEEQFSNILSEFSNEKERIENLYNSFMQLDKPTKFWKKLAEEYKKKYEDSRYWAIGITLVIILFLVILTLAFFGAQWNTPYALIRIDWGDDKSNSISSLIILGVIFSLGLYIIRIFIKIMLSNKHVWHEAEQKAKLTGFFLSLKNEGGITLDDESIKIIIASLFNRIDAGLIKNDTDDWAEIIKVFTKR